jgi:hypothetical protein
METKLRYLFFDELIHAYDGYAAKGIDSKKLVKQMSKGKGKGGKRGMRLPPGLEP